MTFAFPTQSQPRLRPWKTVPASASLLGTLVLLLVGSLAQGQTTTAGSSGSTSTTNSATTNDPTSGATVTVVGNDPTLGTTNGSVTVNSGTLSISRTGVSSTSVGVQTLNSGTLALGTVNTSVTAVNAITAGSSFTLVGSAGSTGTIDTSGSTITTVGDTNGSITLTSGNTNLLTTGVGTTTLSGGLLTLGSVSNTATTVDTTSSGLVITNGSTISGVTKLGSTGFVLSGGQTYSGTIATVAGSGIYFGSIGISYTSTYGSTITLNNSSGLYTNGLGSTVVNATITQGAQLSGVSLSLSNGGSLNLAGIFNSGLNLVSSITSNSGGITLGTSGLSIIAGSSGTTLSAGTMRVNTLGSLPAGNSPNSASFAFPAVALLGVGDVGGQTISERGVVYSLNSANTAPAPGGAGVIKVVHTGLPDATGGFSQTATGLAPNTAYTYRVYAIDSAGMTYLSAPTTFTTPTVLQNWRQTFFGTTQGTNTAADSADPDNDGLPNLIEFATGKDPTTAQSAAAAVPAVNGGNLEYTYTRSLDALNSGTTFTVQWNDSLDPSQWSSSGVSETVLSDNGLLQQVKATLPASSTGRRFVRLNVLPPAN